MGDRVPGSAAHQPSPPKLAMAKPASGGHGARVRNPPSGAEPATADLQMGTARGRWVLLATVLGSSVALLDATVVTVALPALGSDLGASMGGLQWVVNGYTLALASFILLGGALGDRLGRRRVFVVGVVWFALASALCGAAQTVDQLVAARVLQGLGGALLTPGSLAILQSGFVRGQRARAIGAWSALGGVAIAIGPFLGGWLVDGVGWRWVFLINLPLAAVVVAVSLRHVPESWDPTAAGGVDVPGAVLGAVGLAGVTYALVGAGEGLSAEVGASAVVGVLGMAAFVEVERRGRSPMLPLGIFRSRQFTAANLATLLVYAALGALFLLLVVELQVVAGYSALAAGTSLLPITVLMLALSTRAGALSERIGPRRPMTYGPLLAAVGTLLLLRVGPGASYVLDVLPGVTVIGLGLSLTVAPLTATVLGAVEDRRAGVASGVNNAVARAGGLLAVAALPAAVGLVGDAYEQPVVFDDGFSAAVVVCAVLFAGGGVLSALLVRDPVRAPGAAAEPSVVDHVHGPHCRTHCAVGAPPLDVSLAEQGEPGPGARPPRQPPRT